MKIDMGKNQVFENRFDYINSHSFSAYFSLIEEQHPRLVKTFDWDRLDTWIRNRRNDPSTDFQSHGHGRGHMYRAQRVAQPLSRPNVRELIALLELDAPEIALDIVGGNGHMTRVRGMLADSLSSAPPYLITSDLDGDQISSALQSGLPAIRQPTQETLFRRDTFDAVLFAYGTHHIPVGERKSAWVETERILKPNGRVVIQDFATGTPTADWYSQILDRGTMTGHDFEHFTEEELSEELRNLGFSDVQACYMDDSFVSYGHSEQEVLIAGLQHIATLFGLVKLAPPNGQAERWLELLGELEHYFTIPAELGDSRLPRAITVKELKDGRFEAVFPRIALVVTGRKADRVDKSNGTD